MRWYFLLLIILGAIIALFFLLIIIISLTVTFFIVRPKRYSRDEQKSYNKKRGFDQGSEVLERIPIEFKMSDGYIINGDYSLVKGSNKYCILCHGHSTTREGALRYSLVFHELGYSTIIFDERSHGDNVHKDVTMGFKESKDLSEIVRQVYERFGKDIILGLQGVSMGASICLLSLKYQSNIAFIVSDCGYAELKNVIISMLNRMYLPGKIFIPFVNLLLKLLYGFSFSDCRPVDAVENGQVPILYIHGKKDTFVRVSDASELYENTKAKKKLVIFDEASHAGSITVDRSRYKKEIALFLNEIGV